MIKLDKINNKQILFNYEDMKDKIKNILSIKGDIEDNRNLLELGLNSLQIMRLVNQWRREGIDITFSKLISSPYLNQWWGLIKEQMKVECKNINEDKKSNIDEDNLEFIKSFPLTDVQYAYWVGRNESQPLGGVGCHAYFEIDCNDIMPDKLQKAWIRLLYHHPMLRARFLENGEQEILKNPYSKEIVINNFKDESLENIEKYLENIREKLSHRVLDVKNGQVCGLEVSLLPDNKTRIHFDIDLLVADMQSLQVIFRDLALIYDGVKELSAPIDWSFGKYLKRNQQRLLEEKKKAKNYWENNLNILPKGPTIPLEEIPENIIKPVFKRRKYFLNNSQWESLKSKAAANQVTPAMVLLAAYSEILDKWSENSKFLINMPLFDRETSEQGIEDVIADFTNVLLLPIDCNNIKPFLQRIKDIQKNFHKTVEYSSYSGIDILRDMGRLYPGEGSFAPVVFSCNYGTPLISEKFEKVLGKLSYMISQTPQVWLDFQVYEINNGLLLAWDSVDKLFPEGLIDDMFNKFKELINWIVNEESWSEVPESLYSIRELKSYDVENDKLSFKYKKCLHTSFFEIAKKTPNKIAVIDGVLGIKVSYEELAKDALKIATMLEKNGISNKDLVAVTLPRGIDQIKAVLGILAVGACYVPISEKQPYLRRNAIYKKANISFTITNEELYENIKWPTTNKILKIENSKEMELFIEFKKVSSDSLAYIIFTSGSTGEPKGVEISHCAAVNTIIDINKRYNVCNEDIVLALSSLDFDLSVYDIFGILSIGGTVVTITEDNYRDAASWVEIVQKYDVTIWNSVPILLDMFLLMAESKKVKMPSIRVAMLSGDWIGLDLPSRLYNISENAQMVAMGGATEASIWSNYFNVTLPLDSKWKSIPYGQPLTNQIYRVVDRKGRDCPNWVSGELWIGGVGVARGYAGDDELTKERFVEWNNNRWYLTGDIGRYWSDGNIEFLGRKDFQVKVRGHRIELGDIETAIKKYPNVQDAVVITIDDSYKNKHLVGYVISKNKYEDYNADDFNSIEENIKIFLHDILPDYMIPTRFVLLKELPLNINGKLDRKLLPLPSVEKNEKSEKHFMKPKTKTELLLSKIWCEILNINEININDNYFILGGDSLMATKLSTKIQKEFGVNLSLEMIFKNPVFIDEVDCIDSLLKNSNEIIKKDVQLPKVNQDLKNLYKPFPLTDIQKAYWIGRSGAYSLGKVATHYYFEFEGENLDVSRINNIWEKIIKRHDMMRAIILPDGENQQIYKDVPSYKIKVYDLNSKSLIDAEKTLKDVRIEMSHQKFITDKWPLFDVRASCFDKGKVRLHFSFDNIIFDGWSIFHILNEMADVYFNPEKPLSKLDFSFRDYVLATEKIKNSELYKRDKEYWFNKIKDLPMAPELPLAKNPDQLDNHQFTHYEKIIDKNNWTKFKKDITEFGLTPSAVLLAIYVEVIGAWSRHQKFTINLTRFNRMPIHPKINEIVGDFTSLTLLAIDNSLKDTFIERCKNIQQKLWQDIDHSYVSGVDVQRELAKINGKNQGMVMPVVFTSAIGYENKNSKEISRSLLGKRIYSISQTPQVWIDNQVIEENKELILTWDVVKELFPEGLTDDMFEAYSKTIDKVINDIKVWKKKSINIISIPNIEKRIEANSTKRPICYETLNSLFEKKALQYPNNIAISSTNYKLTYKELLKKVTNVSNVLIDKGVKPNNLVAVIMEKGWEQVVAVLGIIKAGAAYLPIDSNNPKDRLEMLLNEGAIKFVLTQGSIKDKLILPTKFELLEINNIANKESSHISQDVIVNPKDLAYVIYTSGSTGVPKGVMIDHIGAVNTILDINKRFLVGPEDSIIALSNLNFDLSVYDIFGTLAAGATIVFPDSDSIKDPSHWLELLEKYNITIWNTVPMFMQMFMEYLSNETRDLPQSLRLVLLSGDWIPLELSDKIKFHFKNTEVIGLGGATEASIWSNIYKIDKINANWKSIPYGKPMVNQHYYILNELMEECPNWVPGRLYIGGIGVAKGYWKNEKKTSERFILYPKTGEKIYYTGDLGRYWPDGNIEFLGREDSQIKLNGYRIELGEIESTIKLNKDIKDAVVIVDEKNNEERNLISYIVPKNKELSICFENVESDKKHIDKCLQHIKMSIEEEMNNLSNDVNLSKIVLFNNCLDHISIKAMCDTFNNIGIFSSDAKGEYTIEDIIKKYKLDNRFKTLITHWLETFVKEGILQKDCKGKYFNLYPIGNYKKNTEMINQLNSYPDLKEKIVLVDMKMHKDINTNISILKGEKDSREVVIDNSLCLTPNKLEKYNIGGDYYKGLLCKALKTFINSYNNKINILEIGGRMGNILSLIKECLPKENCEYIYTDESSYFLEKVKNEHKGSKIIDFKLLNVNKSPLNQGYEYHKYNIIVANNSIHRSKNIVKTLRFLKDMLAPGGILLVVEATENRKIQLNTVALLEDGFSNIEDIRKENNLPLLSNKQWIDILKSQGFSNIEFSLLYSKISKIFGQNLIIAEGPKTVKKFKSDALSNFMKEKLPNYMLPKKYFLLDEIPLSKNGKVDRKILEGFSENYNKNYKKSNVVPFTDIQIKIANSWKDILHNNEISVEDNFFKLGGDSLQAIQCVNILKDKYNIKLSLKNFFEASNIYDLEKLIENKSIETNLTETFVEGEI
ncbi:amino acid adenylation domain-containing protein [Clostridium senegalense]|uniref:Amino acid adenylation domain-containing protein n=2 Tax=Clostridium senegalense TaxID=1465809 RepID=A0A6M0H6Q1_9CLOT|nr:amino acid adenylation domain-containing protein [Clostridium senegalense]